MICLPPLPVSQGRYTRPFCRTKPQAAPPSFWPDTWLIPAHTWLSAFTPTTVRNTKARPTMLSVWPVMRTGLVKSLPGLPVRRPTVRRNGLSVPWWRYGMRNSRLTVRNTGERSCAALLISITRWSRTAVWTAIRRLRSFWLIFLNLWCKQRKISYTLSVE